MNQIEKQFTGFNSQKIGTNKPTTELVLTTNHWESLKPTTNKHVKLEAGLEFQAVPHEINENYWSPKLGEFAKFRG